MSSGLEPLRMGRVFARLSFLPTLALNLLLERVTARTWYSAVDERVLLGALPFRSMARELVDEQGVRAVVSMNEDYELLLTPSAQEWGSHGVEFLQLSTTDIFEAPSLEKLHRGVAFILQPRPLNADASTDGNNSNSNTGKNNSNCGRVYVHCKAGRTRSATLVACYLMQVYGLAPQQAVEQLTLTRPHVWLGNAQLAAIDAFHRDLLRGAAHSPSPT